MIFLTLFFSTKIFMIMGETSFAFIAHAHGTLLLMFYINNALAIVLGCRYIGSEMLRTQIVLLSIFFSCSWGPTILFWGNFDCCNVLWIIISEAKHAIFKACYGTMAVKIFGIFFGLNL